MPEKDPASTTPVGAVVCPICGERSAAGLRFCPHDGSRLDPAPAGPAPATRKAPPSLVGKVLADRYRLLRKIGEGGMGEVYEAQHVYIDKRVAIKTLRAEVLANPEAISRFQQEARAASTIGHDNIVAIEDFGQLEGGAVYMAMEYLEGCSLAERVRHGPPLQRGEILEVMTQVCHGLGAAHDKGIIHRDMKPENIFLAHGQRDRAGRTVAKILDFGIAKVQQQGGSAAGAHLTQTGAVFGTPFYMSPEQALGKTLDPRTDVYSVGVILYELFAGRVPFEGDSFMAILSQHITALPPPPSRMAPPDRPVPPAFERLILKAMSKEREKRFDSMHALGEALADADRRAAAETLEPLDPGAPAPAVELAELPANRRAAVVDEVVPEVPRSVEPRRLALWALAGAAMVLIVVAGTVALRRAGRGSNPPTTSTATAVDPIRGTSAPAATAASSNGVATTEIVLDSIPSGAKVFAGGRLIAETPDALKVPVGTTLEVLLHREGFISKQLTIDPARDGRKVMVRLERDGRHARPNNPSPSPSPTPNTPRPIPPPAPTTHHPAPAPAPVLHPPPAEQLYAPLPPPPPKRPPGGGSARPAPLDPYAN